MSKPAPAAKNIMRVANYQFNILLSNNLRIVREPDMFSLSHTHFFKFTKTGTPQKIQFDRKFCRKMKLIVIFTVLLVLSQAEQSEQDQRFSAETTPTRPANGNVINNSKINCPQSFMWDAKIKACREVETDIESY